MTEGDILVKKALLAGAALGLMLLTAHAPAQAAPVLSSNVDSTIFAAALGATTGWSYLGQSTSAFSGSGMGEVELRSSDYPNSFGYGSTGHGSTTTVFGTGAAAGTTATIAGLSPSYLFWFNANPNSAGDRNTQWTDGFDSGGNNGENSGDIDIFQNLATNTWAFFYDDGGPNGNPDDNDYNDLVVSFRQAASVPEPGTLALLGLGFLGAGLLRRRRTAELK
jgi:hypothetical protein